MDNRKIGIFDSGLGGLTVLSAVRDLLPEESLLYLGDGKNCPYGTRSKEQVRELVVAAVDHLLEQDCKMIVVACNTATAAAIDILRESHPELPFVGMEPAIKPACLNTKSGVVGVLATERSLAGELFQHTMAKYGSGIRIITNPARGFVEIVERGEELSAEPVVGEALQEMLAAGADQIVLGCTHFAFLRPLIERLASGVAIVDSAPAVARRVASLLDARVIRAESGRVGECLFESFADDSYTQRLKAKAFMYNNKLK